MFKNIISYLIHISIIFAYYFNEVRRLLTNRNIFIINGKIYPDSTSGLVLPLVFSTVPLTLTKYNLALPLLINFPAYLTNHANATFGCPQCIDQGIIYIERRDNGVKTVWRIDPILDSIPVQIQPYIQSMTMIVGQL